MGASEPGRELGPLHMQDCLAGAVQWRWRGARGVLVVLVVLWAYLDRGALAVFEWLQPKTDDRAPHLRVPQTTWR